ncbi:hypothetical protein OMAG_001918 [Candidatus Omnitrophus magneticus]|uniref:Uncharacterized protein n=1 Tax=Candidatus Omnitrophus magneticus TaxID=1609969 RepID=A0A0F0CQF9_9BACT|nr:hypothetical protein OMAG_001918 [Candidatus Omnitrophus magneticus]
MREKMYKNFVNTMGVIIVSFIIDIVIPLKQESIDITNTFKIL